MSLRSRVHELERDIRERVEKERVANQLVKKWDDELADVKRQLARELARPSIRHGIDLAFGHPNPHAVKRLGISFVCRYYSFDAAKNLSRAEAEDWSHVGVSLVSVWEAAGEGVLLGYDGGVSAAKASWSLARHIGQPADTPIYFAVDFEPTTEDWDTIEGYFRGCADVLTKDRVGCYGGYSTIEQAYLRNFAPFRWQTLAWSGGQWYPHAQLRQTSVNNMAAGTQCDMDISLTHNFGQWSV